VIVAPRVYAEKIPKEAIILGFLFGITVVTRLHCNHVPWQGRNKQTCGDNMINCQFSILAHV
jgi:hypothetical protein